MTPIYPLGWAYHDTSNALTLNAAVQRQMKNEIRPGCDMCRGRDLEYMFIAYGDMVLCTRHATPRRHAGEDAADTA